MSAMRLPWRDISASGHYVQFYESDAFLLDALGGYISAGLDAGDACVVISTEAHWKGLQTWLKANGSKLRDLQARADCLWLDAEEILAKVMIAGLPDAGRFAEIVGGIIGQAAKRRPHVRAFGEMVALLWQQGNQAAAIRLEELWNELSERTQAFSLLCAYSMRDFAGEVYGTLFVEICGRHSHVFPDENYITLTSDDERLRVVTLLQQKAASLDAEIAERKAVEERLRLIAAGDDQKRLEERKNAFISMASHELKTPVTSLKGFTQILQRRLKSQADSQTLLFLDRMDAQLDKLTHLIGDLLDVAKMQTGTVTYLESEVDLDELVREIVENVQATVTTHQIRVKGETRARVRGDRDRLGQVLVNLLTNAVKYSPVSNTVVVRLSADREWAEVAVQDFGIGIVEEHHEHIFERFYQVSDQQESTYPGLGIGLYIARTLVERQGGRLWLESRKDAGSTFHVMLPRLSREQNARDAADVCNVRNVREAGAHDEAKK